MAISGYIGAGAQEALNDVLQRRLQEHTRRVEEERRQQELELRRETINLQQRAMEEASAERAENRKFRLEDRAAKLAEGVAADVGFGDITPEQGGILEKDPRYAARVKKFDRPVIDARPIGAPSMVPGATAQPAGGISSQIGGETEMGGMVTPQFDTSGPQSRKVVRLEPTAAQQKQQTLEDERARILGKLPGADQRTRRNLQGEAVAAGVINPTADMFGPTEEEQALAAAQKLAEQRTYNEGRDLLQFQRSTILGQREHPSQWVSKDGVEQFVTPSQAAAMSRQGWKHSTAGPGSTEDERKSVGFYRQMVQATDILDSLEDQLTDTELYQIQSLPQEDLIGLMNRNKMSEAAKRYVRAFEQFTEARLRPVSGAVINDDEFARDRRTYAKQFGETPRLNADRRAAREIQIDTLKLRSGRAFGDTPVRPPGGQPAIYRDVQLPGGGTMRAESTDGGKSWHPAPPGK